MARRGVRAHRGRSARALRRRAVGDRSSSRRTRRRRGVGRDRGRRGASQGGVRGLRIRDRRSKTARAAIWKQERYADGRAAGPITHREPRRTVSHSRGAQPGRRVVVRTAPPARRVDRGGARLFVEQAQSRLSCALFSRATVSASYSLDFPGHKLGASGGELRGVDDCIDAMSAAFRFARERGDSSAYTMGHSMGGMTAIFTAALDPAVLGVIAIATGYGRPTSLAALRQAGATDFRSSYVAASSLPELVASVDDGLRGAAAASGRPAGAVRRRKSRRDGERTQRARALRTSAGTQVVRRHRQRSHVCRGALARRRAGMAQRAPPRRAVRTVIARCAATAGIC